MVLTNDHGFIAKEKMLQFKRHIYTLSHQDSIVHKLIVPGFGKQKAAAKYVLGCLCNLHLPMFYSESNSLGTK